MNVEALHAAIAAVCPILGVSIGVEADKTTWRIDYDPSATDAQKAAAQQVMAGWTDPTATTQVNFLGFLALFTSTEQAAIVGSADPRVKLFSLMAAGASYVDLTDSRVVAGTKLLESLGLIASGRAAQVLAGQAPPTS